MLNPNERAEGRIAVAMERLDAAVPALVRECWDAGAAQQEIEARLLDAARARLLQEAQTG